MKKLIILLLLIPLFMGELKAQSRVPDGMFTSACSSHKKDLKDSVKKYDLLYRYYCERHDYETAIRHWVKSNNYCDTLKAYIDTLHSIRLKKYLERKYKPLKL